MKLKYYLRGVGIGIIFATLVMTVSAYAHKYNITDEYIIKEAKKLGMVMKDEVDKNNGLWGDSQTEDSQNSENSEVTENTQNTETTENSEMTENTENRTEQDSENQSQVPQPSETESESESQSQAPQPSESESASESEQVTYVTVKIVKGDYARQVAEKVCAAGLVEDAEDFRKYIGKRGYGQSFHAGTFKIPLGSTYEEICLILISR